MNDERAVTYSLLAHIRNSGSLIKGSIDVFIPLIKRVISIMNSEGIYKGKSIIEIKKKADLIYDIDFPIPVIEKILKEICREINTDESTKFVIYNDGAFSINEYTFTEYEEIIESQRKDIDELEELFQKFCETSDIDLDNTKSIFKFIEKNKSTLSQYISNNPLKNGEDYTSSAQFIDFFRRIPAIYDRIKNIYIGSIITGYLEYEPTAVKKEVELLLDTNFILGLLDLNTPESTHTCQTLIKIAKEQGYAITVLKDTIEETQNLLETKASYFNRSFLQKKINPEDIYNACERRKLKRADLERVSDNLEDSISSFGISQIYYTVKLKNKAKFSEEYKTLKKVRHSKKSALHDATALIYIKKKRGKRIKEFDKVNAWFVNNSTSTEGDSIFSSKNYQPETIKADNLLNILWLSNPRINQELNSDDLANIGLTSIIALTLNKDLPKSKVLRELDDNIHKYAKEKISDTDIVRISTRITNKQLKNIDSLNRLAENDKEKFVKKLENEATKQRRLEENRIKKLEKAFSKISLRTDELEKSKENYEKKSKEIEKKLNQKDADTGKEITKLEDELLNEKNKNRELKREQWIEYQVSKWRRRSWIEFIIFITIFILGIVFLLYFSNWNLNQASNIFKAISKDIIIGGLISLFGALFTGITVKTLVKKYRDHSNIKSYKDGLKIPEELKPLDKPSRQHAVCQKRQ